MKPSQETPQHPAAASGDIAATDFTDDVLAFLTEQPMPAPANRGHMGGAHDE